MQPHLFQPSGEGLSRQDPFDNSHQGLAFSSSSGRTSQFVFVQSCFYSFWSVHIHCFYSVLGWNSSEAHTTYNQDKVKQIGAKATSLHVSHLIDKVNIEQDNKMNERARAHTHTLPLPGDLDNACQISTFESVKPFLPSFTSTGFSVRVCHTNICRYEIRK